MSNTTNDDWDEAAAVKVTPRPRLSSVISVRFSPEEEALLRDVAEAREISVSQLVREATLWRCALDRPSPRRAKLHATGDVAGSAGESKGGYVVSNVTGDRSPTSQMWVNVAESGRRPARIAVSGGEPRPFDPS